MTGSPLARPVTQPKQGRRRSAPVRGLVVHTTGSTIVGQALAHHANPLDYAVAYYLRPEAFFPHYVVGWDGGLVQICDEGEVALHVGMAPAQREVITHGDWRRVVHRADLWDAAWKPHGFTDPLDLVDNASPNGTMVGIEMLPLSHDEGGMFFSDRQHLVVAELAADLFARYAITPSARSVLGHEDLNPLDRWDAGGGWDPGARRDRPRFDWPRVLQQLGLASVA